MLVSVELLTTTEITTSLIELIGARVEQQLASTPLASAHVG